MMLTVRIEQSLQDTFFEGPDPPTHWAGLHRNNSQATANLWVSKKGV